MRESRPDGPREPEVLPALVIIWSAKEPQRCGEFALLGTNASWWLGRGIEESERPYFFRQHCDEMEEMGGLIGESMSRQQVRIVVNDGSVAIENVGQAKLVVNGVSTKASKISLHLGDVIEIRGHYAFLLVGRPTGTTAWPHLTLWKHPFGEPDAHGMIGESAAAWQLRSDVASAGKATPHVLVLGESGTGKELAARAIHALSPRAKGPFVARSAATFTAGLIEAELFGNAKNFPNPGMPEREGFVGAAHGGTLFLDEIGELPHEMQAPLLRVLDGDGEYHRLGETKLRRADIRFIGATNRAYADLKHDLAARLPLRVELPSLTSRREDIPLLARQLVIDAAKNNPDVAGKFVYESNRRAEIHIDAALMTDLVCRPYSTHVRELGAALWSAIRSSPGASLSLNPKTAEKGMHQRREPESKLSPRAVKEALERNHWNQGETARALDLSRYQLMRLMKKHALSK